MREMDLDWSLAWILVTQEDRCKNRHWPPLSASSQPQGRPLSKDWRTHNIRNKNPSLKNVQYSMPLGKGQKWFCPFLNASRAWRIDSSEAKQQSSDIIITTIQILSDGTKNLTSTLQMHLNGISGSFPPMHRVICCIHLVFVAWKRLSWFCRMELVD